MGNSLFLITVRPTLENGPSYAAGEQPRKLSERFHDSLADSTDKVAGTHFNIAVAPRREAYEERSTSKHAQMQQCP